VSSEEWTSKGDSDFYTSGELLTPFIGLVQAGPFPTISSLSIQFIIYTVLSLQSQPWIKPQKTLIYSILQLVSQYTPAYSQALGPNSTLFSDERSQMKFVLFVAEILFDRMPLRIDEYLSQTEQENNQSDEELESKPTLNPLLRCDVKSMFDRTFACLIRFFGSIQEDDQIEAEVLVRFSWLKAKRAAYYMPRAQAVVALEECLELLDATGVDQISLLNWYGLLILSTNDSHISSEHIRTKLRVFNARVQLEEVALLFKDRQYQMIFDRLFPLLLDGSEASAENGLAELIAELNVEKRLELLEQLAVCCKELNHKESMRCAALYMFESLMHLSESEDFEQSLEKVAMM
jgi:hypothetical protein